MLNPYYTRSEESNDMLDGRVKLYLIVYYLGCTQVNPRCTQVHPRCTQHVQLNSRTKNLDLNNFLTIDPIDVLLSQSSSMIHQLSIPHRLRRWIYG